MPSRLPYRHRLEHRFQTQKVHEGALLDQLFQRFGQGGLHPQQFEEVGLLDAKEGDVLGDAHGSGADLTAQNSVFAEQVAGAKGAERHRLAVFGRFEDADLAGVDQVDAVARFALADDDVAQGKGDRLYRAEQLDKGPVIEEREEDVPLQQRVQVLLEMRGEHGHVGHQLFLERLQQGGQDELHNGLALGDNLRRGRHARQQPTGAQCCAPPVRSGEPWPGKTSRPGCPRSRRRAAHWSTPPSPSRTRRTGRHRA